MLIQDFFDRIGLQKEIIKREKNAIWVKTPYEKVRAFFNKYPTLKPIVVKDSSMNMFILINDVHKDHVSVSGRISPVLNDKGDCEGTLFEFHNNM